MNGRRPTWPRSTADQRHRRGTLPFFASLFTMVMGVAVMSRTLFAIGVASMIAVYLLFERDR